MLENKWEDCFWHDHQNPCIISSTNMVTTIRSCVGIYPKRYYGGENMPNYIPCDFIHVVV